MGDILEDDFKLGVRHEPCFGASPQFSAQFARHRIRTHDVNHDGRKIALNGNKVRSFRRIVVPTRFEHILQRYGPARHQCRSVAVAHKRGDVACAVNTVKERLARHQFPQDQAKRVDVSLRTVRVAPSSLAGARAQNLGRTVLDVP